MESFCNREFELFTKPEQGRHTKIGIGASALTRSVASAPVAQSFFQNFGGGQKLFELRSGQRIEMRRQVFYAALTSALEKARTFA